MAERLTDKKKKKIVADYIELQTYNATAKRNGVSNHTVKRIVAEAPEIAEKVQRKKEENTADILAYMERQKGLVCEIIGKGLAELAKTEKLEGATMSQITTALGTLIDKWCMTAGVGARTNQEDDPLSRALKEEATRLENADK